MKKFYISIFTAVFLFTSMVSFAQPYANSYATIPDDGNFHSLTLDPTTWVGGNVPSFYPGCTSCDVTINCKATVDFINPHFNYYAFTDSKWTIASGAVLVVNNAMSFDNSFLQIGSDATGSAVVYANAQMDFDPSSTITLANGNTWIDATNPDNIVPAYPGNHYQYRHTPLNPINGLFTAPAYNGYGPYDIAHGWPSDDPIGPGIVYQYVYLLTPLGIGTFEFPTMAEPQPFLAQYDLNCSAPAAPAGCNPGLVFGPATTNLIPDANSPTSLNNSHLLFVASSTLPVVLVQLLANKNTDGSVNVIWATSQEQNSAYYDVERSGDQSGWFKIGTVQAKGYASTTTNYKLVDKIPLAGTGYYRLKMVDLDGKFTYSKTVAVTTSSNSVPLVVYSNPFSDQIRLKVNVDRAQTLSMTVSDMMGKTYISQTYNAQSGDNFVNLVPNTTAAGMYILRIQGDSYSQTVKLEKQ